MTRLDGGKLPIWWQICDRHHKIFCARDASEGREEGIIIIASQCSRSIARIRIYQSQHQPNQLPIFMTQQYLFFFIRLPLQSGRGCKPPKRSIPFRYMGWIIDIISLTQHNCNNWSNKATEPDLIIIWYDRCRLLCLLSTTSDNHQTYSEVDQ